MEAVEPEQKAHLFPLCIWFESYICPTLAHPVLQQEADIKTRVQQKARKEKERS
jgi:hypothetical protein